MSEFTVCRTLDTHPALRYCLLLDDMRIAGGKPDYRGDNILISWRTKETYGPVDAIKTENSQLATEKAALERRVDELCAEVEAEKQHNAKLFEAAEKWMAKAAHFEAEVERLHAAQAHWELGNCPSCPNIADLQEALEQNAKLREQVDYMTPLALYAASERERDRMRELGLRCE